MSKYNELLQICGESSNECQRLITEAEGFAIKLVNSLTKYLNIPEGYSKYIERGSEAEPIPFHKAIRFNVDAHEAWSIGIEIRFDRENQSPLAVRLGFILKKSGEDFIVTIDGGGWEHTLNLQDDEALQNFHNEVFLTIQHELRSFEKILSNHKE